MTLEGSQVVKVLTRYVHQYPDETVALMPLYDATRDHAVRGRCLHNNRCPIVKAGALLVDEQERVLALRARNRWAFAEGEPEHDDGSFSDTALRVLREFAGVYDAWTVPGAEYPLVVDVTKAAPEDGPRLRVGFRYLFRAHSSAMSPALIETGQARWVPLSAIETPILLERLQSRLAVLL